MQLINFKINKNYFCILLFLYKKQEIYNFITKNYNYYMKTLNNIYDLFVIFTKIRIV